MPPKDADKNRSIFIIGPDGIKVRFDGIKELTISEGEIGIEAPFFIGSMEFGTTPVEIPAGLLYLLNHIPSNNWRKMHGIPMIRKGKGRKKHYEKPTRHRI